MSPEYALHGIFSAKSDVFSYGVLILEIVTGRRNTYTHASGPSEDLLTYVWIPDLVNVMKHQLEPLFILNFCFFGYPNSV